MRNILRYSLKDGRNKASFIFVTTRIRISICSQTLELIGLEGVQTYLISTSKYGPGEVKNSFCTPRGKHIIRAKIGDGQKLGTIFKERRSTGEVFSDKRHNFQEGDWILTRILWLSGVEIGKNRLGDVDTMQRFVYIHGVPDQNILGIPGSKGCINMSNNDVKDIFDAVVVGTPVHIE